MTQSSFKQIERDGVTFKSDIDVEVIQQVGNDAILVAAARASVIAEKSFGSDQRIDADTMGRLNFFMAHRHGSIFEHGSLTLGVTAPICVWREWHRHRVGFSYNEESGRYKQLEPVFYIPARNRPMICIPDWKPGRPKFLTLDQHQRQLLIDSVGAGNFTDEDVKLAADSSYEEMILDMQTGYVDEYKRYQRQLARRLDPGLARDNLPVGIFSSCWVTANPRSLMHFLSLRTHRSEAEHVSYPLHEIQMAADKVEKVFQQFWPLTYEVFNRNGRVAP